MKSGYSAATPAGGVALVAATAKTILGIITPATFGFDLTKIHLGFDGVTATDKAVLVELVAYSADGTGTAGTVNPTYGRGTNTASIPVGFTTKNNYSVEPTGATVLDLWSLTPIGGNVIYDLPLNGTPDIGISTVLGLRLTAPTSAVTARASMHGERC